MTQIRYILAAAVPRALSHVHYVIFTTAIYFLSLGPVAAQEIANITVRGSEFIPEDDIIKTCDARIGEEYTNTDLRGIEQCLMSTGVFEAVTLVLEDDTLVINVTELDTRPGRVDASVSYVAQDGLIGSLTFERYNLLPKTYGALRLEYGNEIRNLTANLYRTDIYESNFDLGLELVAGRTSYEDRSFSHNFARAEVFIVRSFSSTFRIQGGIGYRSQSLFGLSPESSPLLFSEQTDGVDAPFLHFRLSSQSDEKNESQSQKRKRLSRNLTLDHYFWNLGSDDLLSETRVSALLRMPFFDGMHINFGVNAGTINGMRGNSTRTIDRFFVGANTFRGFAPRGIGPSDSQDKLGGNTYVKATIEIQRDFGMIFGAPISGGLFIDTGAVWGLDDTLNGRINDQFERRTSVGVSVTVGVGEVPVSIYVAKPMEKSSTDKEQLFGLNLSAQF